MLLWVRAVYLLDVIVYLLQDNAILWDVSIIIL